MKKALILNAIILAMLASCKKEVTPAADNEPEEEFYEKDPMTKECYVGVLQKDTITAELNILGKDVRSGKLAYNFFEKDKNSGHVSGKIYGDTIILEYNFMSEGKMSTREVAFLKNGNTITEGFGDIRQDTLGKTRFKDWKKLSYDSKSVLTKTDCD